MLLVREPSDQEIRAFLATWTNEPFSYPEVGGTRGDAPPGYVVDHNRVRLGSGRDVFERAVGALRRWEMFRLGWLRQCDTEAPIEAGVTVAVLVHRFGVWSLNVCRIVYVIDEPRRFAFAYGTLAEHAERGEERFSVEWLTGDDSVWYDIFAFSRPQQLLARIGRPFARHLQREFARDSLAAMKRAVDR